MAAAENGTSIARAMVRRWLPVVLPLTLMALVGGCVPKPNEPGPSASSPSAGAVRQRRQTEAKARADDQRRVERCQRERPALEARMVALRQAEARLARVKEETYVPSPPPKPWDEDTESRYRLEDREVDWQRHLQAEAAWQGREERRRLRWWAEHQARLGEAQEDLNREARELRNQRPDLFTGPASIEFKPAVAEEIRQCRRSETASVGETAPATAGPKASKFVTLSLHSDTTR